jgi:biofilm PGA synthesis N-glycosyltransferase PgaC
VSVHKKFVVSIVFALAWTAVAVALSIPWQADLTRAVGPVAAWIAIGLLAYVPGFLIAFLAASLFLDDQPPLRVEHPTTAVTVIVAARNEEAGIAATIEHIAGSDYRGRLTIVLADNGSTDGTREVARRAAAACGADLRIVTEPEPGKSHALNTALATVDTPLVVTVDADTLLHREALRRLVSRLESAPDDTVAVAGAVLVRNSRDNLLTRMQEWDYYLGIAAVKRMQGMYQSTLVAQGAFSLYRTADVRRVGGWPDAIGEDIVVTWRLMEDGDRVYTEPTAVAFTDVPTDVRHFVRQRARWARGMFEGIRAVPPWRQSRKLSRLIAGIDLLIPLLDIGYAFLFIPGVVLALFGIPLLASLWTLCVLPVTLLVYGGLRLHQRRDVFEALDLRVRQNRFGYIAFLLGYQVLCSFASIIGYGQEIVGTRRRWK